MPIEATLGRLAIVTSQAINNQPSTTNYAYDPARPGLLTQLSGPAHNVYNTWEPDRDILKTKTNVHGSLVAGSVISAYDYTVNNVGQRTNVATSGSAFTGVAGWTWGYDALGQVISATHATNTAFNQGYQYDDIGNRKQSGVGVPPESGFTTSYTPNALNQYTTISSGNPQSAIQNPQYDDDGNQLSGSTGQALGQTFVWDGENRLSTVKDAAGNVLVSYTYDHQSRRIRRTDATGTKLFVYDGWNCVSEYTLGAPSVPAALSRILTWGLDLSGTFQGAGGVGGLLSVQNLASSSLVSSVSYPTYDGNGNVSEYLDSTGTIAAHFEYDAFGGMIASSGNAADFDYRFSTKPQDSVTGWLYYGYRWYDSVSGRWPSRDPIGERGGAKLYGMVGNDAVNWVDMLGLELTPKKKECLCDEAKVNQVAHTATTNAIQLSADDMAKLPPDAFREMSTGREFGGFVCCNTKTKEVTTTDPEHGEWKAQPLLGGRGTLYNGESLTPAKLKQCSALGEGWVQAGYYHSHPSSPGNPSPVDVGWMNGNGGYPVYTGGSQGVTRMDPVSVPTQTPHGPINRNGGLPVPVNPDGTTGQPRNPVFP